MPNTLNLFPVKAAIGTVQGPDGRTFDVMMTPQFSRALGDLMTRVGGTTNLSTDELTALIGTAPVDGAALAALQGDVTELAARGADAGGLGAYVATLQRTVADQAARLASAAEMAARLAALERQLADLHRLVASSGPAPVDWEHPGKIGYGAAKAAKFTTITMSGQLTSTVAEGTAPPFVITSSVQVALLNCSYLLGKTWAAPPAIGSTTPSTGAFTSLTATGSVVVTSASDVGYQHLTTTLTGGLYYAGALFGKLAGLNQCGIVGYVYDPNVSGNSYFHMTPYGAAIGSRFKVSLAGALTLAAGFGCNGKAAQPAAASGGTLAGVISALVANGILSS